MIACLVACGVPLSLAVVATVAYQLVSTCLPALAGARRLRRASPHGGALEGRREATGVAGRSHERWIDRRSVRSPDRGRVPVIGSYDADLSESNGAETTTGGRWRRSIA
jgi:hypothetical protein